MAAYTPFGMTPGQTAEAPKKPHLYVGNLSPRVTDFMLTEIFAVAGTVVSAKIVQDRNFTHGGMNYGFVEYADMRAAEQAIQTLNGRKLFDTDIRVNWAYQGNANKEDTQHHFHVFVGDLSPEVNDEVLNKAFGAFGSLSEARVMWDMNSGKSRGYGFLSFRERADADQAIATMNGEWLGSRAIRVNWANQKTQTGPTRTGGPPMGGGGGPPPSGQPPYMPPPTMQHSLPPPSHHFGPSGMAAAPMAHQAPPPASYSPAPTLSYDVVAAQTPEFNTTVYVGNLIPYVSQADLIPLFQGYGYIVEIRMQADRGFAFVKLDSHHNAAMAITHLQNQPVHGRGIKCSWGKDKGPDGAGSTSPLPAAPQYQAPAAAAYPGYGGYYGGQYPQYGAQAAQPPAAATDNSGWDPAAAAAYYQTQGWGGYYSQDGTNGTSGAGH